MTISDAILTREPLVRISVFFVVLTGMAVWEVLSARRPQHIPRRIRWPNNLSIVVVDTLAVRLLFPIAAVGTAVWAGDRGWGLFNLMPAPGWLVLIVSLVLLDLTIYFQHRLFHAVPWLWRLHRMHHADLEFDVTTGLRFHPLEIVVSMAIKIAAVIALGAPPLAVILFEVVLNATSLFNHGNVRLPIALDRRLRWLVVTPDMHRVHHSIIPYETDSNFGFNLPWWDRLFGTYRDQPEAGHDGMTIGLKAFRQTGELRLDRMLLQPFQSEPTEPN
ncbi:sterol desaturase family protein [Saccharospirillum salsuginis]|uniref:Sterol desaturase n=1 Tax=Saccharospirillum salsuginis TaxID=418750 RepID=A0A918KNQ4_9GAMM|nr:sterol desaturase family protein [Saccharospirillum salsuginis]GGX70709.1 sterol desaturase [Saccharospirillum salsuginis]